MAHPTPSNPATTFNVNRLADFERWSQPLLLNIIFYGRVPAPHLDLTIRRIFRLTLERMARTSLMTLLGCYPPHSPIRVLASMIHQIDERRNIFSHVRDTWPETVTRALDRDGWYQSQDEVQDQDGLGVQTLHMVSELSVGLETTVSERRNEFRPLQTYYRPELVQARLQQASLAGALEEFERLTLRNVQSIFPDQAMEKIEDVVE